MALTKQLGVEQVDKFDILKNEIERGQNQLVKKECAWALAIAVYKLMLLPEIILR